MAAVLGEVNGFLAGGISPPHHRQFLSPELGGGAVADGAGADPAAPETLLLGKAKTVGTGASGQDQGLGMNRLRFAGLDAEGTHAQIQPLGIGFNQLGSPADGLGLHPVHQFRPQDAVREAGVVLHVGGGHQLTPGDATGLKACDQKGVEVGPSRIDGCGVAGRTRADDHHVFHRLLLEVVGFNGKRRGWSLTHGAKAEQL